MLPILVALSPCSDPKGNSMFVHPGCTNSGLNALGAFPKALCARESLALSPGSRLLGLWHDRSYSLFVRSMSSSFLSGRITSAADLLFRSLAHRAETTLRPGSLLCLGVSLLVWRIGPSRPRYRTALPRYPSATDCRPSTRARLSRKVSCRLSACP